MTIARAKHLEIMDATLRDGEQTPGISFTPAEKLQIARILLGKVGVDRVEVASARVSEGEKEGAKRIIQWAEKNKKLEKVEILGFVDKGKSVDWIKSVGGKVVNLLTKGSEEHCRTQLRKEPEEHFKQVGEVIDYAASQGIKVNVYLEDWSNGVKNSFSYVHDFVSFLRNRGIERLMLPDTLGIMNPDTLQMYLSWMFHAFPELRIDFHGHNDYGLGTANSLAAANAGVNGIHVTVNGLGERAGNPSLCECVPAINDMSDRKTKVQERQFEYLSKTVQLISGKRLSANSPIVGSDVFTQTCGVHADGDKKGNLYANDLLPNRFSRKRRYALGKLSGKASIDKNLEVLGLELDTESRDKVLREVIRLGDKKKRITPEDLPFIISDVLQTVKSRDVVEVLDFDITTKNGKLPNAKVKLRCGDQIMEDVARGDGGYDAFVKAVRKSFRKIGLKIPKLLDYEVRIPPGGKTDALVETTITWENNDQAPLVTVGVDSDQVVAAIEATSKMLNFFIPDQLK